MNTTIICPHCNKEVEITQALRHQIGQEVESNLLEQHQKELQKLKKETEEKSLAKAKETFALQLKTTSEEAEENRKQNKDLQEQLLELTRQMRKIKQEDEQRKLEMEKKLAESEEKIRADAQKSAEESSRLKILEKEKQLNDALKKNEELRQKLQQGSQQNQGEVFELELETILRNEFSYDQIKEVLKGVRGADLIQEVFDRTGRRCGSIVWEVKNAQWNSNWITKLKEDKRAINAEIAVLVTVNAPPDIASFAFRDGVWITNKTSIIGLATALRMNLIHVFLTKLSQAGKGEKMEVLYNYLSGVEFRSRVEALIESFTSLQDEIEREKRWFSTKWARQEKHLRLVIDATYGMHGDLQGIMGTSLPEIKQLKQSDEGKSEID